MSAAIRPLVADDLDRIKEIDALSFAPHDRYGDETYGLMLSTGCSVVVEDASRSIVAYAFIQKTPESQLRSIAVHPEHRGRGHARALLDYTIDDAADAVVLFVDEANAPARTLYESVGFEPAELCAVVAMRRRMILAKTERGRAAPCPACAEMGSAPDR